jgi:hypothetical protein
MINRERNLVNPRAHISNKAGLILVLGRTQDEFWTITICSPVHCAQNPEDLNVRGSCRNLPDDRRELSRDGR